MTLLSPRLEAMLQLIRPCAVLADVGTDHGFVPVAAVQRGLATRAIAADLRDAPLLSARQHIESSRVADRVTLLKGDGLVALQKQAVDAVVMAGVSAALMVRLCEAAPQVLATVQQLVLQPNTDVPILRAWALRHGWHLRDERMVQQRGRFFTVCAFVPGSGDDPAYSGVGWTESALCEVGPWLVARKDAVALRFCEEQRLRLQHLVHKGVRVLAPELQSWQRACELLR